MKNIVLSSDYSNGVSTFKNQNIYQGSKDSAQTFSSTFLRKCSGSKVDAANNILIADIYLFAKVLSSEILCIIQNF